MNYIITAFQKYAVFSGRARRKEYWLFFLFNIIIGLILGFVEGFSGINPDKNYSILGIVFNLAVLLPSLAVAARRMHDVGKSGWFMLIPIYNLVLACTNGTDGSNEYGPDPKKPEPAETGNAIKHG